MKVEKTDKEINELHKIKEDLILSLFDTKDKRYCIERELNNAFELGVKHRVKQEKQK